MMISVSPFPSRLLVATGPSRLETGYRPGDPDVPSLLMLLWCFSERPLERLLQDQNTGISDSTCPGVSCQSPNIHGLGALCRARI